MIEHVTEITVTHRVTCNAARPRLISNLTPQQGYTVWCQRCQRVELISWELLPRDVLEQVYSRLKELLAKE